MSVNGAKARLMAFLSDQLVVVSTEEKLTEAMDFSELETPVLEAARSAQPQQLKAPALAR